MAKDYERKVQTSESLMEVAIVRLLIRRHATHATPHGQRHCSSS
jgi:hypothetical protein